MVRIFHWFIVMSVKANSVTRDKSCILWCKYVWAFAIVWPTSVCLLAALIWEASSWLKWVWTTSFHFWYWKRQWPEAEDKQRPRPEKKHWVNGRYLFSRFERLRRNEAYSLTDTLLIFVIHCLVISCPGLGHGHIATKYTEHGHLETRSFWDVTKDGGYAHCSPAACASGGWGQTGRLLGARDGQNDLGFLEQSQLKQ